MTRFAMPDFDDDVLKVDPREGRQRTFTSFWYNFLNLLYTMLLQAVPPSVTQSKIAKLQTKLGRTNSGTTIYISDFRHTLRWDGDSWDWAPGESGGGFYADFDAATPPTGAGWHLCDGTTVDCLQADGSMIPVTLPTVANQYFRQ